MHKSAHTINYTLPWSHNLATINSPSIHPSFFFCVSQLSAIVDSLENGLRRLRFFWSIHFHQRQKKVCIELHSLRAWFTCSLLTGSIRAHLSIECLRSDLRHSKSSGGRGGLASNQRKELEIHFFSWQQTLETCVQASPYRWRASVISLDASICWLAGHYCCY